MNTGARVVLNEEYINIDSGAGVLHTACKQCVCVCVCVFVCGRSRDSRSAVCDVTDWPARHAIYQLAACN